MRPPGWRQGEERKKQGENVLTAWLGAQSPRLCLPREDSGLSMSREALGGFGVAEPPLPIAPAGCWGELSSWGSAPSPEAQPVPSCLVLADKGLRKARGSRRGWNRTQLTGQRDRGVLTDRQTDRQPRAGGSLAGDGDRSCPGAAQPPRRVRAHQLSPCRQKTKETAPKPGGELALPPGAVQRGGRGVAVTSARPGASGEAAQAVASPAVDRVGRRFYLCCDAWTNTKRPHVCSPGEGWVAIPHVPAALCPGFSAVLCGRSQLQGASRLGAVLGSGGGFRDSTALTEQSSVLCQQAKPQRHPAGPPRRQLRGPGAGDGGGGLNVGSRCSWEGFLGNAGGPGTRRSSPRGIRACPKSHGLAAATPGFPGDKGSVFRTSDTRLGSPELTGEPRSWGAAGHLWPVPGPPRPCKEPWSSVAPSGPPRLCPAPPEECSCSMARAQCPQGTWGLLGLGRGTRLEQGQSLPGL